jgi:hypothetical protein
MPYEHTKGKTRARECLAGLRMAQEENEKGKKEKIK